MEQRTDTAPSAAWTRQWAVHRHFPELIVHGGHELRPVGGSIHDHRNRDYYANSICRVSMDKFGAGRDANARLIAAAPALYGAAKDLLAAVEIIRRRLSGEFHLSAEAATALVERAEERARAALRQADGAS